MRVSTGSTNDMRLPSPTEIFADSPVALFLIFDIDLSKAVLNFASALMASPTPLKICEMNIRLMREISTVLRLVSCFISPLTELPVDLA